MKTKSYVIIALVGLSVASAFLLRGDRADSPPAEPEPALATAAPTFIELGSDRCTSCSAMIPVLEELRSDHDCALNVRFIDVWDTPAEGERFGVSTIPTQILLAADGSELARHTGFWSADAIRGAFASSGHPLPTEAGNCDP